MFVPSMKKYNLNSTFKRDIILNQSACDDILASQIEFIYYVF